MPGDDVIVTGVLRMLSLDNNENEKKDFLDTIAISEVNSGNMFTSNSLDFSDEDLEEIESIRTQPSVFRLLVNSLAPRMHGLEMV